MCLFREQAAGKGTEAATWRTRHNAAFGAYLPPIFPRSLRNRRFAADADSDTVPEDVLLSPPNVHKYPMALFGSQTHRMRDAIPQ
jgi:hypothetical protein